MFTHTHTDDENHIFPRLQFRINKLCGQGGETGSPRTGPRTQWEPSGERGEPGQVRRAGWGGKRPEDARRLLAGGKDGKGPKGALATGQWQGGFGGDSNADLEEGGGWSIRPHPRGRPGGWLKAASGTRQHCPAGFGLPFGQGPVHFSFIRFYLETLQVSLRRIRI